MKLDRHLQPLLLELATLTRAENSGVAPKVSDERKELDRLLAQQEGNRRALTAANVAVDDMELEIRRVQEDERKLRRREAEGKRQLAAEVDEEKRRDIKHDIYAAKSRIADLMSELQEAHNEIHALRNNRDLNQQRVSDTEARINKARAAVDALGEDTTAADRHERIETLRLELPSDVVAQFDEQRDENKVGVASFNNRSCGGCFIILPPADISIIRRAPMNVLPQCPDCGSYLVRQGD
ncbi:zinc ribbon domain-containing protein [Corynebacterium diphtheriae]